MNSKPIILVTGATGAQGGSVARALLYQKKFEVRCFTRNPDSSKAKALQKAGAILVKGDLDDLEGLKNAMKDCYAVFGVTNYWEHHDHEYVHGKNLVDAVKSTGIQHFVFSTLPDYSLLSEGKFPVPHYDIKAALERYARQQDVPATFVRMSFYYENFLHCFRLQPTVDGGWRFGFPQGNTNLAMVSVEDLGGVVAAILDHPAVYIGFGVNVVGDERPCGDYAKIMTRVLKKPVYYEYVPRSEFIAQGFRGCEDMANMFEVQRLYIPDRRVSLIETHGLNPSTLSFESWLICNREKFNQEETKKERAVIS